MELCFNERPDDNAILNFSEMDTINYYISIKKELCITCNIIIEDKIKFLSEKRNSLGPSNATEKLLETEPVCNFQSIICTSCMNKLSTSNTFSTDDEFENILQEFLIFPEINEKQPSLLENQVPCNGMMSSSVSETTDQQVSSVEEMQYTQTEKSTSESLFYNDNMKWFPPQKALFDHVDSPAHLISAINDRQTPLLPICKSNFSSMVRYEHEIYAEKYYNSNGLENHNCEQINSTNMSTKSEQGSSNDNFNPELLNMKGLFDSQSQNNNVMNTDHTSVTRQRTLRERANACKLEFDKDFISAKKARSCNDSTTAFISADDRDKHSMKPYLCHLCSKGFIRKILLSDHIKSHWLKTTMGSHKEISEFNQVDGINKKQKEENTILKCSLCKKTFNSKQALTRHLAMHEKCFPTGCFKCLTCQEVFPFEKYVKNHLLTGCKPQIFSECGNNLGQYEEIKIYKFLVCEFCSKGYEKVDDLNNHRITHKGQYLFVCTLCQKKFKSYWKLRCHQRSHDYSEEYKQFLELRRVFACHFCTLCVSNYSAFKHHLSKHQEKRKVQNQAYETLKPLKNKKKISNCLQEIKRKKCSKNKVLKRALTQDCFTAKQTKGRTCKNIVIDIISCGSKLNNETKECSVDHEECIISCHPSNKQQLELTYQSNYTEEENNKTNEIFQCTDFTQDDERVQVSLIHKEKSTQPTKILKDHPRRRLHDCKFCSKRFKKACNLVRHMKGTHT